MSPRDKAIAIIAETLEVPRAVLNDESALVDLAQDSIKLFELLIRLEECFDYKVKYEDISHIESVGDIIAYVETVSSNKAVLSKKLP